MSSHPNILERAGAAGLLTRTSFSTANPDSTPIQTQVDGLVTRFVDEAASPTTLGALMAGGMAYRLARVGVMGMGSSAVLRPLSLAVGLGSEVTAFEFTNRTLHTLQATGQSPLQAQNPNLWSWSGAGGWQQGLLTSLVTFGMLKGAGSLAREQNIIFQHAFQSTAMVVGHNATNALGITPRPEGSLAEQFLHAEAMNLQLGAGMGLISRLTPGLQAWERGLDVSLSVRDSRPMLINHFDSISPQPVAVTGLRGRSSPESSLRPLVLHMSSNNPKDGGGSGKGPDEAPPPVVASRRRPRADETVRVNIIREESSPPQSSPVREVRIDASSALIHLMGMLRVNLRQPQSHSLEFRVEGEMGDADVLQLKLELFSALQLRHQERPFSEDFAITLRVPERDLTLLFRLEEGVIRVARVMDAETNLVMDDTPNPQAEERAASVRTSIPPAAAHEFVASTSGQIFEYLKTIMRRASSGESSSEGGSDTIHYAGLLPRSGEVPGFMTNIGKWLRMTANQLPVGHSVSIVIEGVGKRIVYEQGAEALLERVEDLPSASADPAPTEARAPERVLAQEASPQLVPPPLPESEPLSSPEALPPDSAEGTRTRARRPQSTTSMRAVIPPPPPSSAETTKAPMRVVTDPFYLVSEGIDMVNESRGEAFEIVYTGERRLGEEDFERFETQKIFFSHLNEGQRFRVHSTHSREVLEFVRQGDTLVQFTRAWAAAPTLSATTVRDWGELVQTLTHFLQPPLSAARNPTLTYMGSDWAADSLDRIGFLFKALPLAEGQSLTLQTGRGGNRTRFYGENNRIFAETTDGEISQRRELTVLPEPSPVEALYLHFFSSHKNPEGEFIPRDEVASLGQLPGASAVPTSAAARDLLFRQLSFSQARTLREGFEVLKSILGDSTQMGRVFSAMFNNAMGGVVSNLEYLRGERPQESLAAILSSSRSDLPKDHQEARADIFSSMEIITEALRIFKESQDARFLRTAYIGQPQFGLRGASRSYKAFYEQTVPQLPPELQERWGLNSSVSHREMILKIRRLTRKPSQP